MWISRLWHASRGEKLNGHRTPLGASFTWFFRGRVFPFLFPTIIKQIAVERILICFIFESWGKQRGPRTILKITTWRERKKEKKTATLIEGRGQVFSISFVFLSLGQVVIFLSPFLLQVLVFHYLLEMKINLEKWRQAVSVFFILILREPFCFPVGLTN